MNVEWYLIVILFSRCETSCLREIKRYVSESASKLVKQVWYEELEIHEEKNEKNSQRSD